MLSRKQLNDIGERLIRDFNPDALKYPQEIDIDLFAQDYLGMEQDFQYLSHCGVYLGMTVFNDTNKVPVYDPHNNRAEYISAKAQTVIIDRNLLADNQEHRYRFTMGHEASHGFLHKEYFRYDLNQLSIFDFMDDAPISMIQCRVDMKKAGIEQSKVWGDEEWMEWQANALSSAMLMPKSMVQVVVEEINPRAYSSVAIHYIRAMKVSEVFNVSFESATYRLKELGLLHPDQQLRQDFVYFLDMDEIGLSTTKWL